jgi:hypothetical protein
MYIYIVPHGLLLCIFLSLLAYIYRPLMYSLRVIQYNTFLSTVPHINSMTSLLMALARGNQAPPMVFQRDSSWSGIGEGNVYIC